MEGSSSRVKDKQTAKHAAQSPQDYAWYVAGIIPIGLVVLAFLGGAISCDQNHNCNGCGSGLALNPPIAWLTQFNMHYPKKEGET